ncbi:MAG: shikimate dehydrogenase family protein [Weeksellaceae bacterium]
MKKEGNLSSKKLGLVGRNIQYSFSPSYFKEKFNLLGLEHISYELFDLSRIEDVLKVFETPHLLGLNVTIPYKQEILSYLDQLSPAAQAIGAVNTIDIKGNKKVGHNTDYIGFSKSIKPLIKEHHKQALILGTGGANKAIQYAIDKLNIPYHMVSRNREKGDYTYNDLNEKIIQDHQIIINTTPLGTFPHIHQMPTINVKYLTSAHLVYDLIYNPEETTLLNKAKQQGATIKNGLEMLQLQADAAWEIWNKCTF